MALPTPDNALLWNASVAGILAGQCRGRPLTAVNTGTPPAIGTPDASYAAIATECADFAQEIDSAIVNDNAGTPNPAGSQAISVITTGVAIVPSTGAIQAAQIGKSGLLEAITLGQTDNRYSAQPTALTPSEFAAFASQAEFAYEVLADAYITADIPGSLNNQLLYFAAYNAAVAGMTGATPDASAGATSAPLTAIGLIGVTLATAIDAGITTDSTMTAAASAGLPKAPEPDAGGNIQLNALGKYRLMFSLTLAAMYGRNALSLSTQFGDDAPVLTTWATSVAAPIIAEYKAMVASLQVTHSTTGTPFNQGLWNEAFCGYVAGIQHGRPVTSISSTDANYLAVAAAAVAFATEVDAAVGAADTTGSPVPTGSVGITAGAESNGYIVPTTGQLQESELGKSGIMWAIARGVCFGRQLLGNSLDTTAATYSAVAQSVVALYLQVASAGTALQVP